MQNTSYFGRWLLKYAGAISSYMELPALNAILSLFYLGIFAAILVELAGITRRLICWLLGVTLASLPAFTTTLMFGYAADAYMLALVLAGAAALIPGAGALESVSRQSYAQGLGVLLCPAG